MGLYDEKCGGVQHKFWWICMWAVFNQLLGVFVLTRITGWGV